MVFYASCYAHDWRPYYRYTIVAPSVEVVDEWYRLTRDAGTDIHRHAPDFYTHPYSVPPYTKLDGSDNQKLKEQLRFTQNNDQEGIYRGEYSFPDQFAPDHTSGKAFYIRSKSDPTVFWHDNDGFIVASKTERTKFRVTGKTRPEKDHVMIRSDHISITVIGKDNGYVRNDDGILVTGGSGNDTFLFSDFKTAFLPSGVSGDAVMKKVENDGDEWELVA
ncbi:hypothetical protein BDV24DRAFT_168555 [Aspergillus arachidicola]|uniref:Uncharacterized protein n=1 Tax=Aspergillus arachidicola TaxID=656916 RepID=A0A2G7FRW5_9EURO|nr:hypothetical protein BDV24DRAFT_168555 [Aspergillus arachidicola]PIG82541.1 hypothetical protein AARAC_010171 [Aspergillus arachidicola]